MNNVTNKLKVLHISCDSLGNGGVQAVIMGICRNLQDIRFDIMLYRHDDSYYESEFKCLGGNIFMFPSYEGKNKMLRIFDYISRIVRLPIYVYKLIKQNGPYAAIHCHNYFEGGLCCLGAALARVPVRICHSHSVAMSKRNLKDKIYSYFLKPFVLLFSNVKVGCSRKACEYLFGKDLNTKIIINGIDLQQFNFKIISNIQKQAYSFVHVGQYNSIKNQSFLLDVFQLIHQQIDDATLDLMGFGVDEAIIKAKIEQLGLSNFVVLHKHDEDRVKLYAKSEYMIFPSLSEGFGIVLIEAQSMGVYCFASNSVPTETDAGLIEYLSLSDGAKSWADNILSFIKRDKSIKMPDEGKLLKYDFLSIVEEYRHIYQG